MDSHIGNAEEHGGENGAPEGTSSIPKERACAPHVPGAVEDPVQASAVPPPTSLAAEG